MMGWKGSISENSDRQRSMSVAEIKYAITTENGEKKESGLMDRRLGTTEKGFLCLTCSATATECPGHFGHIELCKPNFHIGFLDITLKILRCVCYHCSALLCNTTDHKFQQALSLLLNVVFPLFRFLFLGFRC